MRPREQVEHVTDRLQRIGFVAVRRDYFVGQTQQAHELDDLLLRKSELVYAVRIGLRAKVEACTWYGDGPRGHDEVIATRGSASRASSMCLRSKA